MASFKRAYHNCCSADVAQRKTFSASGVVSMRPPHIIRVAHVLTAAPKTKYSADFSTAQNLVAAAEGGYQNIASDSGNWTGGAVGSGTQIGTAYGISAPTLKAWLGREPTVSDMQNLTQETAMAIYQKNYWTPINGNAISDQDVANMIYDAAVNSGVGKAKSLVTDTLNTNSYNVSDINAADPTTLFNQIGQAREDYYNSLGGSFLGSWLARLQALGYTLGAGDAIIADVADTQAAIASNPITSALIAALAIGLLITGIVYLKKIKL